MTMETGETIDLIGHPSITEHQFTCHILFGKDDFKENKIYIKKQI